MPSTKKTPTKRAAAAPAPVKTTAPKDTATAKPSRVQPVKMLRTQVAPHVKTLSNGQPRPKRRSK